MMKRMLAALLCAILVLTLLPAAALAEEYGGDVSDTGLDLTTRPTVETTYTAGSGHIVFTPAVGGGNPTLTLNDATIAPTDSSPASFAALALGSDPITLILIGSSSLTGKDNMAMCATSTDSEATVNVTINGGGSLTLNGNHSTYGSFRVGNLTISDSATVNSAYGTAVGNVTVGSGKLNAVVKTVGPNRVYGKVTIDEDDQKSYSDLLFELGSEMVVNGKLTIDSLAASKTFDDVKAQLTGSGTVVVGGKTYIKINNEWIVYGEDVTDKVLNLTTPPTEKTAYKAGRGTIVFTPAVGSGNPTLTLNNATTKDITLKGAYTLALNGTNNTGNILAIQSEGGINPLTITATDGASLTAPIISAGSVTGATSALNTLASTDGGFTFYGTQTITGTGATASSFIVDESATVTVDDNVTFGPTPPSTSSTFTNNGKIIINRDKKLDLSKCTITSAGSIENNGILTLPGSTTKEQIVALNLTGNGVVEAGDNTYTNGGAKLIKRTSSLDFTNSDGYNPDAILENDGYTVEGNSTSGYKITLGNLLINVEEVSAIKLPVDGNVTVLLALDATTVINSGSGCSMEFGGEFDHIITGNGKLVMRSSNEGGSIQAACKLTIEGGDITISNTAGAGIDGITPVGSDQISYPAVLITGGKLYITVAGDCETIRAKSIVIGSGMKITDPAGAIKQNVPDTQYCTIYNADGETVATNVLIQPAPAPEPPAPHTPIYGPSPASPDNDDYDYTPAPVTVYNDPSAPNATVWLTGSGLDSGDLLITERDPKGSAYEALMKLADSDDVFATYNIYLRSGKKKTGSDMQLTFDLNSKYGGSDFTLVHQKADSNYEYFYDTADAKGDLSFGPLYELSPFMLVKGTLSKATSDVTPPQTGDNAQPALWIGVALITAAALASAALAGAALYKRRRDY